MHLLRLFPVLLITLLILAACGGQLAAENVDTAPAAAVEETAMDDTAKDDMAETEASAEYEGFGRHHGRGR